MPAASKTDMHHTPRPPVLALATQWISEAALEHGANGFAALVAERLNLTRHATADLLRKLVAAQWLVREGTPRRAVYRPGPLRQVVKRYALAKLQEDQPWREHFAPCFDLPVEVQRMAQHAFGELLNNAIEHSGGKGVTVSMRQTPLQLQLLVSDNGCGVFHRIAKSFDITEPRLAMLELSKGKLTSAPARHRGHGLFFTSRLADVFYLHANDSAFQCLGWQEQRWRQSRPVTRVGTSAYLAIALDTPRTLDTVLRAHGRDEAYAFERTTVPLHLLGKTLDSRAEARRVSARLAQFARAELDFTGITEIGHGFADELFRVFKHENPTLELLPRHMAPPVAAMVAAVHAA